jgi:hypothetical protein
VSYRLAHQREHAAQAGVEEQWSLVDEQDLIEGEAAGHLTGRHRRADAIHAVGDLVNVGS